jgi:hypothetical protein
VRAAVAEPDAVPESVFDPWTVPEDVREIPGLIVSPLQRVGLGEAVCVFEGGELLVWLELLLREGL